MKYSFIQSFFSQQLIQSRKNEIEQSFTRLVIGFLAFGYTYYSSADNALFHITDITITPVVTLAGVYLLTGIALHLSLYLTRWWSSKVWRTIALVMDVTAISIGILLAPLVIMPLFSVYLWIIIGYGFRYGVEDLITATIACVVGFSIVLAIGQYNKEEQYFAGGIFLALIIVPSYVYVLLKRMYRKNKALEEERQKAEVASEAKSAFLSNITHELRTPLNGVVTVSELLYETDLNEMQRGYTQTIYDSANTLVDLINNILDFSKIEANEIHFEYVPTNIHDIAKRLINVLTPLAEKKKLAINNNIHLSDPYYFISDPTRLTQVLINLVNNAIKFTDHGSITISIYEKKSEEDEVLYIEVLDTGIGIKPEDTDAIFERFQQADNTITRNYGGTGLGLAISKQIVEQMEGKIGVISQPGIGSRFWVELPLNQALGMNRPSDSVNALLVTSNTTHIRDCSELLGQWGVTFESYNSLAAAFEFLQKFNFSHNKIILIVDESIIDAQSKMMFENLSSALRSTITIILASNQRDAYDKMLDFDHYIDLPINSNQLYQAIFNHQYPIISEDNEVVRPLKYKYQNTKRSTNINKPARILIAEDQAVNQLVIENCLSDDEFDLTIVSDGEQALEALENNMFDLTILDYHMPNISGLDVVKMYRFIEPNSTMPFLMITADDNKNVLDEMSSLVDGYLTKPIHKYTLIEKIGTCLSNKSRSNGIANNQKLYNDICNFDAEGLARSFPPSLADTVFLQDLFDTFKSDAIVNLNNIKADIESHNINEYYEDVHALKGIALNVNASRLHHLAQDAEKIPDDKHFTTNASFLLDKMKLCLSVTYREMETYINLKGNDKNL
jgi:two-component system sensor histidine kinase RpfC